MHTCKKCKAEKAKVDMSIWGGKVSEICKDCREKMRAGRGNGGGSPAVKSDPPTPAEETDPPADGPIIFEVPPSFGFTVKIDGEQLVISQDNADRPDVPDNITLNRTEARQFLSLVERWAAES